MKRVLITSIGCAPASVIARILNKDYYLIGIDIQDMCIGNFIVNKFIQSPKITDDTYWSFIDKIIEENNIEYVFPIHNNDIIPWLNNQLRIENKYNCKIFSNNKDLIEIADDKQKTYDFCINNNINIPKLKTKDEYPIIIKPRIGCGSLGIITKLTNTPILNIIHEDKYIIQEFITGDEYTIDILADNKENIINIIPKQRLLIKNGQSFKSKTIYNTKLIQFASHISKLLHNNSFINIQVIIEKTTDKIYLIEINARFPTTISLTIKSGANIPVMLLENDTTTKNITYNLTLIRDYIEYYTL